MIKSITVVSAQGVHEHVVGLRGVCFIEKAPVWINGNPHEYYYVMDADRVALFAISALCLLEIGYQSEQPQPEGKGKEVLGE